MSSFDHRLDDPIAVRHLRQVWSKFPVCTFDTPASVKPPPLLQRRLETLPGRRVIDIEQQDRNTGIDKVSGNTGAHGTGAQTATR